MNIIKFEGENKFLVQHLQRLYDQRVKATNFFDGNGIIFTVKDQNNKLNINNNYLSISYQYPLNFDEIFTKIQSYLFQYNFKFNDLLFYPFSNTIKKEIKFLKLNFIHNTILSLILFHGGSVNKEYLYKVIWPGDFEISINKLDTHFTNLKELVKSKFGINLNLKSNQGCVSLVID